jgi:hypothetical protein
MSYETDRRFYGNLLKIFMVLAVVGIAVLVYTSFTSDPTTVAFSLIAFMISVAALMMTTLQSLSISRQLRITENAMKLMRETDRQLEELVDEDKKLSEEVRKDIALDLRIVEVLEEVGVGDSEQERQMVAARIAKKLGDNSEL